VSLPPKQTAQVIGMLRWLLIAIFVVLGWITLSYLAHVLAPVLAALGIAYLLSPVLDRLVHHGFNRAIGAGVLLIGFLGLLVAGLSLAIPAVAHQVSDFVDDAPRLVTNLDIWLHANFGVHLPHDWKAYVTADNLENLGSSGPLRDLAAAALGGLFVLLGVVAEVLLVPVFAFYFLVDWPNLIRRVDHMIPPRKRRKVRALMAEIDRVLANWVRGQGIVTSILAVLYAICFTLVGMPLSLPIGLLVGALTVIPFVGTFVGAAIAGLVTLADGGSMHMLGQVAAVIVVLHLLEAALLTPKIVGHRVGLSETGALFAVVAGGKLLGFVGVVLAVPIAATCAVLVRYAVRYYETTEFFGRESDADVVITPSMALIMPGIRLEQATAPVVEPALPGDSPTGDEWSISPELPESPGRKA
jgi:predicted PurR-regulated permease PerM